MNMDEATGGSKVAKGSAIIFIGSIIFPEEETSTVSLWHNF